MIVSFFTVIAFLLLAFMLFVWNQVTQSILALNYYPSLQAAVIDEGLAVGTHHSPSVWIAVWLFS